MAGFGCSLACSRQLGQQSEEDYSSGRGKNSGFVNVGVLHICMFLLVFNGSAAPLLVRGVSKM